MDSKYSALEIICIDNKYELLELSKSQDNY